MEIAADASAAQLRQLIAEEGVEDELNNEPYAFAVQAANAALASANEATTPIVNLFMPSMERAVLLVPAPSATAAARAKFSVILVRSPTERESIGFIEDVDSSATLDVVR